MKMSFAAIAAAALCVAAQGALAKDTGADARFKAIYTKEWAWRKAQYGIRDEENKREPLPDYLPSATPGAEAARLAHWTSVLKEVNGIPRAQLSPKVQVDYDVYKPQIAALIPDEKFRDFEMPVNSDSAFYSDLTETARRDFNSVQDYRNYVKWLRDIPRYFREEIAEMRAGLKRGFTPPKITLTGRDKIVEQIANAKPEESVFLEPFKKNAVNMPGQEWNALRADTVKAVQDAVLLAYRELLPFMRDEYIPHARNSLAAEALPGGKVYYRSKILKFTTLDLDPAKIHQIGVSE